MQNSRRSVDLCGLHVILTSSRDHADQTQRLFPRILEPVCFTRGETTASPGLITRSSPPLLVIPLPFVTEISCSQGCAPSHDR